MSLTIKAATAMHFAGAAYAAGDTIDTTGMNDRSIAVLLKHQPVYVSAASSAPGTPVLKAFPFAFDTPGLTAGHSTGYSPAVGDILLDAWIDVVEAWDGTTPHADAGFFSGSTPNNGLLGWGASGPADLTFPAAGGAGDFMPDGVAATTADVNAPLGHQATSPGNFVPARFTASLPIKIVVNQTGVIGGAASGSAAGSAVFYMLVVPAF